MGKGKRTKGKNRKGKHFEEKTHQIVSALNPNLDVTPNVEIVGKLSESSREVDLVLRDPSEFDFIAYECKDVKSPVGTPIIEGYATKLVDIGAKKGAIVSNSSFTRGARRMAEKLGIELLHLVDTGDPEIKTKLIAPSAVVHDRVKRWSFFFKEQPPPEFPITSPELPEEIIDVPNTGEVAIKSIANAEWNKIADSPDVTPGNYEIEIKGTKYSLAGRSIPLPPVYFHYEVEVERRAGVMDITHSTGIYNVKDRSFQTNSLAIGNFSDEIFKTWTPIDEGAFNRTVFTAVLHTRTDIEQRVRPDPQH